MLVIGVEGFVKFDLKPGTLKFEEDAWLRRSMPAFGSTMKAPWKV